MKSVHALGFWRARGLSTLKDLAERTCKETKKDWLKDYKNNQKHIMFAVMELEKDGTCRGS